jgi:CPA2 family monovalent cation:H+ antiporter-2
MQSGTPLLIIEEDAGRVAPIGDRGLETIAANGADPEVMQAANLPAARCILVAIPDAFEGGQVVAQARERNPSLPIVARAHSEAEIEHLRKHGATAVVMGEHEIAKAMLAAIPAAAVPIPVVRSSEPSPSTPPPTSDERTPPPSAPT